MKPSKKVLKKKSAKGATKKPAPKGAPPKSASTRRDHAKKKPAAAAHASAPKPPQKAKVHEAAPKPAVAPAAPPASAPKRPQRTKATAAEAPPEKTPPPVDARPAHEHVPGEPMPGGRVRWSFEYALRAMPKAGGTAVFGHTPDGTPFIHGHVQRAAHKAFLPSKGACHVEGAVGRPALAKVVKMIKGVSGSNPTVRIDASGRVYVKHEHGQPEMVYDLDPRPQVLDYEPPVEHLNETSPVPLRIDGGANAAATKCPEAIVETHQAANGIEWVTLTAREGGELLARAVIAEDGHDLYPEDDRQAEFEGQRTVGQKPKAAPQGPVSKAVADFKAAIPAGGSVTITAGGQSATIEGPPAEGGHDKVERAAAEIRERLGEGGDRPPVDVAPPPAADVALEFPAPGELPVVFEIPEALWDALSPDALAELHNPPPTRGGVAWFSQPDRARSSAADATKATEVAGALLGLGLGCAGCAPGRRDGLDVDVWTVGRVAVSQAAV